MKNLKKIFLFLFIIIVDIVLYIVIGLILLTYEDFYEVSKGEYWSLSSMTLIQKLAYVSYYILIILNLLALLYLGYRLIKKYIIKS